MFKADREIHENRNTSVRQKSVKKNKIQALIINFFDIIKTNSLLWLMKASIKRAAQGF